VGTRVATGQLNEGPDDLPIETLDLRVRTYNCLKRSDLHTVGQILALERTALLSVRHFTRREYEDLRDQSIHHGVMGPDAPRGPFIGGDAG
jgi:DNA-directed RNA polymerase subunit alpha